MVERGDQPLRTYELSDDSEGKLLLMFGWGVEEESDGRYVKSSSKGTLIS